MNLYSPPAILSVPRSPQVADLSTADLSSVLDGARSLWSEYYGASRASGIGNRERRSDCGITRAQTSSSSRLPSMQGWLQDRKQAVGQATAQAPLPPEPQEAEVMWSQKHTNEIKFLQDLLERS